ncbi:MAG: hypothetical protein PVG12_08240, partial [Gammaproteobacteria bacterium]
MVKTVFYVFKQNGFVSDLGGEYTSAYTVSLRFNLLIPVRLSCDRYCLTGYTHPDACTLLAKQNHYQAVDRSGR